MPHPLVPHRAVPLLAACLVLATLAPAVAIAAPIRPELASSLAATLPLETGCQISPLLARIRHYAGSATCEQSFNLAGLAQGEQFVLGLGGLRNLAEVTLNGRRFGALWSSPLRIDITAAVRPWENLFRLKIVNLWQNRLSGDPLFLAAARRTRTNVAKFEKPAHQSLLPSGSSDPFPCSSSADSTFSYPAPQRFRYQS